METRHGYRTKKSVAPKGNNRAGPGKRSNEVTFHVGIIVNLSDLRCRLSHPVAIPGFDHLTTPVWPPVLRVQCPTYRQRNVETCSGDDGIGGVCPNCGSAAVGHNAAPRPLRGASWSCFRLQQESPWQPRASRPSPVSNTPTSNPLSGAPASRRSSLLAPLREGGSLLARAEKHEVRAYRANSPQRPQVGVAPKRAGTSFFGTDRTAHGSE